MLRLIRTGDIILAENKYVGKTNVYSIANVDDNYLLMCISCGQVVANFGNDKSSLIRYLKTINIIKIISSDEMLNIIDRNVGKLKYPILSCYNKNNQMDERYINIEIDDELLIK